MGLAIQELVDGNGLYAEGSKHLAFSTKGLCGSVKTETDKHLDIERFKDCG